MVGAGDGCGNYGVGGWTVPSSRVLSAAGTTSTRLRIGDPSGSWAYGIGPLFLATADTPRISLSRGDLCVYLTEPRGVVDVFALSRNTAAGGVLLGVRATHAWRFAGVTTTHRRLVGGHLLVTGVVAPAHHWVAPTASLQRIVGRTWRTVATVAVPASGRYRASVTAGAGWYRVLARSTSPEFLPTAGSAFRVVT